MDHKVLLPSGNDAKNTFHYLREARKYSFSPPAEIAEELTISIKIVETYKMRVMKKIGATKRSELVQYALEQGLLDG